PGTNRMNVAAGEAHDGSLIVLASGWGGTGLRDKILPVWVCRSSDGGQTWERNDAGALPQGADYLIPFGDVVAGPGSLLAAAMPAPRPPAATRRRPHRSLLRDSRAQPPGYRGSRER